MLVLIRAALSFVFPGWLFSCSKNSSLPGSIAGQWSVVNDTSWKGAGANNHQVAYAGRLGDSYYFAQNSLLYTNLNNVLDTFTYKIISPTSILLNRLSDLRAGDTVTTSGSLQLNSDQARISGPYIYT